MDLKNTIIKALEGNEDEINNLLRYYSPLIKATVRKIYAMVKKYMSEDDLFQEADILFIELLRNYDPSLSNFGYYIKLNFFRNLLSRTKTNNNIITSEISDTIMDLSNPFDRINFSYDLENAMKKIPEKQRLAIKLYYFKEMPQEDCAIFMSIGQSAFSKLLDRASKNLKKLLTM